MNPARRPALHDHRHHRGAGHIGHRLANRVAQDLAVRPHQGRAQERVDVGQLRPGLVVKQTGNHLQGQFGCDLALRVPAHAVGEQEQRRAAGIAVAHAIFVVVPAALAAELKNGELHFSLLPTPVIFWTFFRVSVTMVSN